MHIDLPWNAIFLNDSLNMSLILPESDQIPVLRPPVRLRGSRQIHPFQDIRLALRIVSVQNIGSTVELQDERIIIPVIC